MVVRQTLHAILVSALALALVGCSSTRLLTVRHPSIYMEKGRPAWTYDENRIQEDLIGEASLPPELQHPNDYNFFLGVQTIPVDSEESARIGAQLGVLTQFKAFLRSSGRAVLENRIGAGLGQDEARAFETRMNAVADAEARQLKVVRWYLEEERNERSSGHATSRWKAWCLAAFSKARCDQIYENMVTASASQRSEAGPVNERPTPASPTDGLVPSQSEFNSGTMTLRSTDFQKLLDMVTERPQETYSLERARIQELEQVLSLYPNGPGISFKNDFKQTTRGVLAGIGAGLLAGILAFDPETADPSISMAAGFAVGVPVGFLVGFLVESAGIESAERELGQLRLRVQSTSP